MWNYQIEENILYEDKEILVQKNARNAGAGSKNRTMDMESALKNYLAQKPPRRIPYLGK